MSPSDARAFANAHRKARSLEPDVSAALLRAFALIRAALSDTEVAQVIASGRMDLLVAQVVNDQLLGRAFLPVRLRIRESVQSAFRYTVPSLPSGGKVNGVIAVAFDTLSPDVITAIRTLETASITALSHDTREVVRAFVENGLRDGKNPKAIARGLRDVIGLSPTQEVNAQKHEAKLLAQEKPLAAEKVERMVAAYRKRAASLNAATNARTITLDAFKEAQNLAWQSAIDRGIVDGDRLTKTWVGILDERERPEHVAMEGETVPFNAAYSNGEFTPGVSTYNCRCLSRFAVA